MTVAEQIRSARQSKGMTLKELADRVGTDVSSICRWERGGGMTIYNLERICKALGIQVIISERLYSNKEL